MMRLYHILITIILYPRNGLAGIADEINRMNVNTKIIIMLLNYNRAMSPFQHFDHSYNEVINNVDDLSLKRAKNYAKKYLKQNHNLADQKKWPMARDDIIYHYLYFSSTLKHLNPQNEDQTKIYFNIYLMTMAYDAAMDFRVCVLYYSTSSPKIENDRIKLCQEMFEYMEWFFLFMKDEKLKGFCEINTYPQIEECTPPSTAQFTAKDACEILKKLNLNFLKTQNEVKHIPPLQKDSYNLFKPEILNAINPDTHELYFKPLFPDGVVNNTNNRYGKDLYELIISRIEFSYTQEHFKNRRYFRAIFQHIAFDNYLYDDYSWQWEWKHTLIIWSKMRLYKRITEKAVKIPRQVYYKYGDTILRSNAVDVLRTRINHVYWIVNANISKYDNIHNISNSNDSEYFLICAPKDTGVDYIYTTFLIDFQATF